MKLLYSFMMILFLAGTTYLPANATPSAETVTIEMAELMEMAPTYICAVSASFEINVGWLIGGSIEIECTGTGTSNYSASEACDRAIEVLQDCILSWF